MTATGEQRRWAGRCWAGERGLRQEDGTDLALLKPECSPFLQTPQETGKREAGLPDVLASTRSTFLPFLDSNARLESGARDSEGVGELEKPPKPERSSARENSGSHAEQRTSPHEPSPSCGCTVSGSREVGPRLQPQHQASGEPKCRSPWPRAPFRGAFR